MEKKNIAMHKDYLKKTFGIKSFQDLHRAAKKISLDIGIFVAPVNSSVSSSKKTSAV